MRIWTFRRTLIVGLLLCGADPAHAELVTRLPTQGNVIALTFDACETRTPAAFDKSILATLLGRKIPFTVFVSGRFARHNQSDLAALAKLDTVEIENHSLDHDNHMDQLDDETIRRQVVENDTLLFAITGRHTRYFRFPAGNVNPHALKIVEDLGYRVVHWRFASGDPAHSVTPEHLSTWVLSQTRPGDILIFHINGRGWSTGAALPGIISHLEQKGYRFTTLAAALP